MPRRAHAAGVPEVVRQLEPVLQPHVGARLRRFFRADDFRVYLDDTCMRPRDWRHEWRGPSRREHLQDRLWWASKYGAQGFIPAMIQSSPFVASDWRLANASLVVLYVPHLSGALAVTQQQCLKRLQERSQ